MKKKIVLFIALLCAIAQGAWAQYEYYDFVSTQTPVNPRIATTSGNTDIVTTPKYESGGGLIGEDYQWFIVQGKMTIPNGLTTSGYVRLLLLDGCELTVTGSGITVPSGSTLHIYAQSFGENAGKLIVKTDDHKNAAIGCKGESAVGDIIIYGGYVEAHSQQGAAGIGGGWESGGGNVDIYAGTVKAYGGEGGAGIGCGEADEKIYGGGTVNIYGGTVFAQGGKYGAGIGGGKDVENGGGYVNIHGGNVTANGGAYGAGIGGGRRGNGANVLITGGTVKADGGMDAAGIGSGEQHIWNLHGGRLEVSGGYVYADGTGWSAGIGGGEDAKGAEVIITGGTVIAYAGSDAGKKNGSAIGSEDGDGRRGSLNIANNMMVHAGQNPTDAANNLFPYGTRVPACYFRPYTRIEPCDHQGKTYTINGTGADGTHTLNCTHCLDRTTSKHTFDAGNQCTVCGVRGAVSTVSIYLPEAEDGSYTDGHYASTPRTQTMVTNTTIKLPAPPVTYLPNGVEFAGWAVGTPTGLGITSYWKGDSESVLTAGTSYTVTGDVSLTARYKGVNITLADNADNGETLSLNNGKTAQSVTISGRTLYKDGNWNTLVLPFDVETRTGTPLDGAEIRMLDSENCSFDASTGLLTINFTTLEDDGIKAGYPFLVKWPSGTDIVDPVFNNVVINAEMFETVSDYIDFVGTYSPEMIYQGVDAARGDEEDQDKTKLYLGADNTLYYPTATGFKVNSLRAYFRLKNGLTAGDPTDPNASVRAFKLNLDDDVTGITNTNLTNNTNAEGIASGSSAVGGAGADFKEPRERSGNGSWYDLSGRKIINGQWLMVNGQLPRGIYINNGRKVVIK